MDYREEMNTRNVYKVKAKLKIRLSLIEGR